MAIELQEEFQVAAPIDEVWKFLMDPERMIPCLPGASVSEIVSDEQFVGSVKLKIGAITAKYAGTITYTTADQGTYTCVMLAEAKEKGGGTVSGTITTTLAQKDGVVEAMVESCIDMTGRVVQVGRGMIEGVASEIIGKFVKNIKTTLEVPAAEEGAPPGAAPAAPPEFHREAEDESINVLAVVFKVMWQGIVNFFKRLFGKGK
jgi:carbon monoxide dehydrogenase subunit G